MLIMSRNSKVELWNGSFWVTIVINEATIFVPFRSLLHEWTPFYASISLINTYLYPRRNIQFQMLIFLLLISLPFSECFWQKKLFRQISSPSVRNAFQRAYHRMYPKVSKRKWNHRPLLHPRCVVHLSLRIL